MIAKVVGFPKIELVSSLIVMHIIYFKILLQGALTEAAAPSSRDWPLSGAAGMWGTSRQAGRLSTGTTYVLRRKQLETSIQKAVILQMHTNII